MPALRGIVGNKTISLRTRVEMVRGRGAVNEAQFIDVIQQFILDRNKKTGVNILEAEPVIPSDNPDEWMVHVLLKRVNQFPNATHYEIVLESFEPRKGFPSDELLTKIALVS